MRLVEPSRRLLVLGVENAEYKTFNPELTTPSIQSPILNVMKTLEKSDSIELKSIDNEKTKQTKNPTQEMYMTEHIEGTCGCPKKQIKKEEMNELNEQTNDITLSHIHASDVQTVESTITNHEAATPSVVPSEIQPSQCGGGKLSLVYALGVLSYDFGSETRRDAFIQNMEGDWPNPDDPTQLLKFIEENPEYADSLIWTLEIEGTPVYAIRPVGNFALITHEQLREFLKEQQTEGVERVSIPGVIAGKVRLLSGQEVPVIIPELRGMNSWSTEALLNAVIGPEPNSNDENALKLYLKKRAGVCNFIERVYYELMNLGRTSQERAMNFAGTNAYQAGAIFEQVVRENLMLDSIETDRSPFCRPGSDCWDMRLTFFDPANRLTVARKVYRFTVDVSDVVPVTVGKIRSWSIY